MGLVPNSSTWHYTIQLVFDSRLIILYGCGSDDELMNQHQETCPVPLLGENRILTSYMHVHFQLSDEIFFAYQQLSNWGSSCHRHSSRQSWKTEEPEDIKVARREKFDKSKSNIRSYQQTVIVLIHEPFWSYGSGGPFEPPAVMMS